MKRGFFAAGLSSLFCMAVQAAAPVRVAHPVSIYHAIDTPTSEVLEYGSFAFTTRFFREGGVLANMAFGVFQRLMIGASFEVDNYIGHEAVDLQRPELQMKFRFYDGDGALPAMAVGYDGQGYHFDDSQRVYLDSKRGLFLTLTQELLVSGFEVTAGGNIADFERDSVKGFLNFSWTAPGGGLNLVGEYDNIRHSRTARLNAGMNLLFSPFLQMGFHARDLIGEETKGNSSEDRRLERIIEIRYRTSF
ncbi:MAG: hypothetical protein HY547_04015 [Elusimicrobia bacterium]|nr:hypothetical protein [Elusimicrobiota bacterium]